ncbi:MAG: PIN domain-containing protein [Mariprofundaceae bacterium]|nr:PIN domain-containing protein [Mariprofundaceae bacterium]
MLQHPPREIAIPAIVVYELEVGLAKSAQPAKRRAQLESMISRLTVIPLDVEEARAAAGIRARLEALGTPIGPMDTLIAGTALAHQGTLATHNSVEFSRVDG